MQLGIAFAVPNEIALQTIANAGPIVQIGAGAAYWLRYCNIVVLMLWHMIFTHRARMAVETVQTVQRSNRQQCLR
jgi:hypothetical protein